MSRKLLFSLVVALVVTTASCAVIDDPHGVVQSLQENHADGAMNDGVLRVMTLNLAHGRLHAVHQVLIGRRRFETHLDAIANVFDEENPDLVACQEADGPSYWSGKFDHVAYLAGETDLTFYVRGEHVGKKNLSYGTALLSRVPLADPVVHTFDAGGITPNKGFTLATAQMPDGLDVDVVSVHLDFALKKNRKKQVEEMISVLERRDLPLIVMGDFNSEWDEGTVEEVVDALDLNAYRPRTTELPTFKSGGRRLDWILVSPDFDFADYEVVPDDVSDHKGVYAELTLH